jgi:Ca2+-binding RTX toxin-like protein
VLSARANPATLQSGGHTARITANLTRNSAGQNAGSVFPDGTLIRFQTQVGTIEPVTATTRNGTAQTTLTSGNAAEAGKVFAFLDNAVAETQVTVQPAPQGQCNSQAATVFDGTPAADILTGTFGIDLIRGFAGDDTITGFAGDDCLIGNDGEDLIRGSRGDDLMQGHNDDDRMIGSIGDDRLYGNADDDGVYGNTDDDIVNGAGGDDRLSGGPGEDKIVASSGDDRINSRDGESDVVLCGSGRDAVRADALDRVNSSCEFVNRG